MKSNLQKFVRIWIVNIEQSVLVTVEHSNNKDDVPKKANN